MRLGIENTEALWEVDATDFQRVFDVNVLDSSSPYTNEASSMTIAFDKFLLRSRPFSYVLRRCCWGTPGADVKSDIYLQSSRLT